MPKFYETFSVPTEASKEVTVPAITSTEAERKKLVAVYPDDSLTTSYLVVYQERMRLCDLYLDNLVGEASKRIEIDREIPLGQMTHVGYRNPAAVSGDKLIVCEYELIG